MHQTPRPDQEARALPIVSATTVVDLTGVDPRRQRHALAGLDHLPRGTTVRLIVATDFLACGVVAELARAATERSLHITVEGPWVTPQRVASELRDAIACLVGWGCR